MEDRLRQTMVRGVLAVALAAAVQPPAAAFDWSRWRHTDETRMEELKAQFVGEFVVPKGLTLAEPWRSQVHALANEHRQRVGKWVEALSKAQKDGAKFPEVMHLGVVAVHYFNEHVAWQLDRVDDADDARLVRAMADPRTCSSSWAGSAFTRWLVMLERMPEGDRDGALQAQAVLLARWGQPRPDLPSRPAQPWLGTALAALAQTRSADRPVDDPLAPPVLMAGVIPAEDGTVKDTHRCALVAWHLQRDPLRQAPVAERARVARLALAWDPLNDVTVRRTPGDMEGYPPSARRFGVQGTVRVAGQVSASGQGLTGARVVAREVTVEGLVASRPVAYEAMLDVASLERAATTPIAGRAPGDEAVLDIVWSLK